MSTTCYTQNNGVINIATGQIPCGSGTGVQYCCQQGDQCGGDGFCHFTHAQDNTVTGFYLGGCTDRTHSDSMCPQHCGSDLTQDVVFNSANSLWKCCYGDGGLNCDHPSVESFLGPSPDNLLAAIAASTTLGPAALATSSSSSSPIANTISSTSLIPTSSIISRSISSTSVSSASTSSVITQSATSTPSAAAAAATPSSTSTGAIVAPAVIVPIVAIVGGIAALIWYRRRRRARATATGSAGEVGEETREYVSEMSARPTPGELGSGNEGKHQNVGELEGDHARELYGHYYKPAGNAHAAELAGLED